MFDFKKRMQKRQTISRKVTVKCKFYYSSSEIGTSFLFVKIKSEIQIILYCAIILYNYICTTKKWTFCTNFALFCLFIAVSQRSQQQNLHKYQRNNNFKHILPILQNFETFPHFNNLKIGCKCLKTVIF